MHCVLGETGPLFGIQGNAEFRVCLHFCGVALSALWFFFIRYLAVFPFPVTSELIGPVSSENGEEYDCVLSR